MPGKHFYEFGPYRVDVLGRRLLRGDTPVPLTPKAFDTLLLLVENRERAVPKPELMRALWPDSFVEDANLSQHVFSLRRALGEQADGRPYIETVPRHGYRFVAEAREVVSEGRRDALTSPSSRLPTSRTVFVGRAREMDALTDLLARDEVRVVTLTGPGGVGKTRLAVETARRLGDRFDVVFVPLAPIGDPPGVVSAIARAVGAEMTAGSSPGEAAARSIRANRTPVLVVLDNFEHAIDAAPAVTDLVEACPNLKTIVTSRALLHVYGERECPVAPLAVPDPRQARQVDTASCFAAVALFVDRAVAARPDFALTAENAETVAAICARLDGLPMAIELAAARIKILSPTALLSRLDSRLLSLSGGARDVPPRLQTIRNAIDWSHDLLSAPEQRLFRRLGVFSGGWTLEAVEAVCNAREDLEIDAFEGVASLVDKSLLQPMESTADDPRFAMLETLREYALERLAVSGDTNGMRRAHAAYCLVLSEESAFLHDAVASSRWLRRCDEEHGNFRAALEYLFENADAAWGLRLALGLLQFWQTRGYLSEGREQLSRFLDLPNARDRTELRAQTLFALGTITHSQREFDTALAFQQAAFALFRAMDDRKNMAVSVNGIGVVKLESGEPRAARGFFEEALVLWREIGDDRAIARTLSNLASAADAEGDHEDARRLYRESRSMFERAGDQPGFAWSLVLEGDSARAQRDAAAARALYDEALARFRSLGDGWGIGKALMSVGQTASDEGNDSRAGAAYDEALRVFWLLGDRRGTARVLEALAVLAAGRGETVRALTLGGAAASLRHVLQTPLLAAERAALDGRLEPLRHGPQSAAAQAAWNDGWKMSLDEAVSYARLTHVDRVE